MDPLFDGSIVFIWKRSGDSVASEYEKRCSVERLSACRRGAAYKAVSLRESHDEISECGLVVSVPSGKGFVFFIQKTGQRFQKKRQIFFRHNADFLRKPFFPLFIGAVDEDGKRRLRTVVNTFYGAAQADGADLLRATGKVAARQMHFRQKFRVDLSVTKGGDERMQQRLGIAYTHLTDSGSDAGDGAFKIVVCVVRGCQRRDVFRFRSGQIDDIQGLVRIDSDFRVLYCGEVIAEKATFPAAVRRIRVCN